MKKILLTSLVTFLTSSYSSTVLSTEQEDVDNENNIEAITVYGQKRAQHPRDVSVAISVLDEETLKQLDIKDTTQLSAQIPNVKITANTGEGAPPVVNIRGVGSLDYNNTTTAPVGFYLDNVAGGALSNSLLYLFDMQHIEVLKGPQGTLFGRNTTGGAVLLHSKRPEKEFGGFITAGIANQNHQKFEGVLNTPINDTTAARLAFSHQDYDYSSTNLLDGVPQAGMRQNNFKLLIEHKSDDFSALFKLHGADWDGIVKPVHSKGVYADPTTATWCSPELAGSLSCTDAFGFNDGSSEFHDVMIDNFSPHTTDREGASLELTWQLSNETAFTSITSYNHLDRLHTFNCDAGPADLCDGDLGVDNTVFTQELRLNSQIENHYIIAGLFYIDESIEQDNTIDLFRDFRVVTTAGPAQFFYDNTVDIKSTALFGQVDTKLSEKFTITTGLRFTSEETTYRAKADINVPTALGDFTGITFESWDFSGNRPDDEFSGKIALIQQYSDKTSFYYSLSRGFKSGGYNGSLAFSPDEARLAEYGPETLTAFEVGTKLIVNNNTLLNMALFHYDYKDQQVFMNQQSNEALSAPVQVLDNIGESTIYGAEADLTYQPTNTLLFKLGLGYLPEANLKEYADIQGNIIKDNRLPFTSKWNTNGLVNYQQDYGNGTYTAQLEFDYQSSFYFDQNQNPYAEQDNMIIWNGRISYLNSEKWEVALWAKNIFDDEYSQIIFDMSAALGTLQDLKGEGRRFGAELIYSF